MRDYKALGCYSNWSKSRLTKSSQIPIGARNTFQIYEDAHELDKESGKANKWWKDNSFNIFLEKRKEDDVVKKQGKFP